MGLAWCGIIFAGSKRVTLYGNRNLSLNASNLSPKRVLDRKRPGRAAPNKAVLPPVNCVFAGPPPNTDGLES